MIRRGHIGILLLAAAVVAGVVYGFLPRAVPVELVAAEPGPLAVTVEEEGKTRVRERYAVSAPVAGFARRITLKVGDRVAAGQVVAVLEPSRSASLDPRSRAQAAARMEAAAAALQAAVETARAAAAESSLAELESRRAEALGRDSFLSAAAVDQARTRLQSAQAGQKSAEHGVQVARHELAAARAALAQASALGGDGPAEAIRVTAPVAGSVLQVPHESEGAVQAGQTLLEIGNPDSLEIVVEVLSTAAVRIAPGTPVRLDRWGGPERLEGVVRVVEPAGFTKVSALGVEEQRVRVIVDLSSPPETWRRLGDGYRVEAAFVIWAAERVLLAPASALFRHDGGWAAFVDEAGRARLRPVRTGQRNGLSVEITGGLRAGDRVIAHPDDTVAEGTRIRAR